MVILCRSAGAGEDGGSRPTTRGSADEELEPKTEERFDPDRYEMDRAIEREWEAEDGEAD